MPKEKPIKKYLQIQLTESVIWPDPTGFKLDVTKKMFEKEPKKIYTVPDNKFWWDRIHWGKCILKGNPTEGEVDFSENGIESETDKIENQKAKAQQQIDIAIGETKKLKKALDLKTADWKKAPESKKKKKLEDVEKAADKYEKATNLVLELQERYDSFLKSLEGGTDEE